MKKSFKSELFVSFVIIALVTILVSGIFMATSIREKIEFDYKRESLEQLESMSAALEDHIADVDTIMTKIIDNEQITKAISEGDSWEIKKAYNNLYNLTASKRELTSFSLYDADGVCVLTTKESGTLTGRPTYWGLLKIAKTHPEEAVLKNATYDIDGDDAAISIARAIMIDDDCKGFVVAGISADNLHSLFNELYSFESEVVVLDEFWDEVYSSDKAKESGLVTMLHDRRFDNVKIGDEEDGFLFQIRKMDNRELYLVIGRQTAFTESLSRTIISVILVTAVLSLILCFIVARVLSTKLMQPLNNMTEAMEKVRGGDLTVRMDSTRQDEFGQLARDFDDMTKALKVYLELRSKQQQELSESNIAMMQAQLNPHFLYNTLDTIKWVAKANHIPELATLSSSLAKILRASISSDIFVPLSKEMDFINHYIEIQKIRFPENFSFDAEVPMELEDCIVPKLILQPIVENAIVHGLKDRTHGHIFLNAYEQEGRLVIDVEDDGCGMDDDMISILNTRDREKLKGHIGFYNADAIIRIHYGLNYGIHAENLKEGGVRVSLVLPIKYGAEGYKEEVHV